MQVIVNPYHRSVTIDGVEVVQKILEFPNELNHLSTISCTYDSNSKKITQVHDLHRFTSNFIEREYFFEHLPVFVDWFYKEKQAQIEDEAKKEQYKQDIEDAYNKTVQAGNTAVTNINTDKTEALNAIESSKTTILNTITSKRAEALNAVQDSKIIALNEITNTTNTSINSITGTTNSGLNNLNSKENEALNKIATDKAEALSAILSDRQSSLDAINSSINKATTQADRSKTEADRSKYYADQVQAVADVRPATKEQIGLVIIGDNINVNETGVIDVPLSSKATQDEEGNEVPEIAGVVTTDDTLVNNNGKIGVNEALYLKLAGGKLTGNLTMTHSLFFASEAVVKGQNPSANVGWNFFINDKDEFVSTQENSLGRINTTLYPNGNVRTFISAYQNTKGSSNDCTISVNTRQDGTKFTSAPTPTDNDDDSTQIATTEWVNKASKVVHTEGDETITGVKEFTSTLQVKHEAFARGEAPSQGKYPFLIRSCDKNGNPFCGIYQQYTVNMASRISLLAYKGLDTSNNYTLLSLGYTNQGEPFTSAPTPPADDNSTQIATTEWCTSNISNMKGVRGSDLNTLIKPGFYHVSTREGGATSNDLNFPSISEEFGTSTTNGELHVISAGASLIRQILYRQGTNGTNEHEIYTRQSSNGGTSWGKWRLIITDKAPHFSTAPRPLAFYDNKISVGTSASRFTQLYATTTTIATSDEREKSNIADIDEALMRAWGKVNFKQFQFNNAVAEKGNKARIHVGVIAQQVIEAFKSEGLDAMRYGIVCYDEWEGEKDENGKETSKGGNRYGIRYEEALALECAYQRWRLEKLEAKLNGNA